MVGRPSYYAAGSRVSSVGAGQRPGRTDRLFGGRSAGRSVVGSTLRTTPILAHALPPGMGGALQFAVHGRRRRTTATQRRTGGPGLSADTRRRRPASGGNAANEVAVGQTGFAPIGSDCG